VVTTLNVIEIKYWSSLLSQKQITGLVDSNLHTIDAAIQLLSDLPSDVYSKVQKPYFESSLGKHMRHIIDHYLCFRRDFDKGVIDYDQRHRDSQLETDIMATIMKLAGIETQQNFGVAPSTIVHNSTVKASA